MAGLRGNADHPFLRPLWRRILLVLFCVGWGLFELQHGVTMWTMIAFGMAAYGAWIYLITYRPAADGVPAPSKDQE